MVIESPPKNTCSEFLNKGIILFFFFKKIILVCW